MRKQDSKNTAYSAPPVFDAKKNVRFGFFKNLSIGRKLTIGFAILVLLTFVSAGISYLGSQMATVRIDRTADVHMPTAITASRARTDLFRVLVGVRGYLALGETKYYDDYLQATRSFEADLQELTGHNLQNATYLHELKVVYKKWVEIPQKLFRLRDNQLEREPAYQRLAIDGVNFAGEVLIAMNEMIDIQAQRSPTKDNMALLRDMARFQGNFLAMLSGLRIYVTTRNRIYRGEYEVNFIDNQNVWDDLIRNKETLSPSQQELLENIRQNREDFLALPDELFKVLDSDHWREDLYLFKTEAVAHTDKMLKLLADIASDQVILLETDLEKGRQDLSTANWLTLIGGIITLFSGVALAFISRRNIAGPVRRLTGVAEQIRGGDLEVLAHIESRDEIGILAETFNSMTSQLRQTLFQVRKEKRRADDLLEVVIPIGVELSSEKDYNRLLEKMLLEAKAFCHADAGTLYLLTEDRHLEFVIVRNDSHNIAMGGTSGNAVTFQPLKLLIEESDQASHCYISAKVAVSGVPSNIDNYNCPSEILSGYVVKSLLTIPLKNLAGQVKGVMQLINAQDPDTHEIIPFDQNLQQMMESFSSLAIAALEAYIREQALKNEIQQLRVEIDEVKRQKQVEQITETESFQSIQAKAAAMRQRRSRKRSHRKDLPEDDSQATQ